MLKFRKGKKEKFYTGDKKIEQNVLVALTMMVTKKINEILIK